MVKLSLMKKRSTDILLLFMIWNLLYFVFMRLSGIYRWVSGEGNGPELTAVRKKEEKLSLNLSWEKLLFFFYVKEEMCVCWGFWRHSGRNRSQNNCIRWCKLQVCQILDCTLWPVVAFGFVLFYLSLAFTG